MKGHMKKTKLSPWRTFGTLCTVVAIVLASSGCATVPPQAGPVANRVGYRLADRALKDHPERRVDIATAASSLHQLATAPTISAASILEVVDGLPFAQSEDAKLFIDGSFLVLVFTGDPQIKEEKVAGLRVISEQLALGAERRLALPQ